MPDLRIEIHAMARDPEANAVVSVRINGRQVAQIEHAAVTAAEAMTSALAEAIRTIGREEARRVEVDRG